MSSFTLSINRTRFLAMRRRRMAAKYLTPLLNLQAIWTAQKNRSFSITENTIHIDRVLRSFGTRRYADPHSVTDVSKQPVCHIFKLQARSLNMYGGVKVILYSFLTWHQFNMNHRPLFRPLKSGKDFSRFNDQIQINQLIICNNFSSLLIDIYVQHNKFRASSHPSSRAQQLQ
jgi:hypothetical protein